jgi:predicted helicase
MSPFDDYIQALQKFDISDVTEHTYRKELQILLETLIQENSLKVSVLHEPKRKSDYGAPDFKVKHVEAIIGYIENKKLTEDLDKVLNSPQLKKYNSLSNNILLTNYIEWIWLRDGSIVDQAKLCDLSDITGRMRFLLDTAKVESVKRMILNFFIQAPKGIKKPKQLAEALAIRARYLRDFLHEELNRQASEHTEGRLYGLYDTFKTNVFHELSTKEFSDAFSQTLVYGLFLARLNAGNQVIDIYNAKRYILPAFGLIRELVDFLDVLDRIEYRESRWIVEEIVSVMNTLDLRSISKSLSYEKFRSVNLFDEDDILYRDPYIYFYEHFLAAYDKKLRKQKGVYYTPPQVVNFIVRSIGLFLQNIFNIESGFSDVKKVTVLDFAAGTGTFLLEILEQIFEALPKSSGKKDLLIRDHILKNFFGFEYLIAPYTVANLKLSQFLKDQGFEFKGADRFQIYLTNTLEPVDKQMNIPLLPTLSKETKSAQSVKDNPILIITGNPPYAGESKNPSFTKLETLNKKSKTVTKKVNTWIGNLIKPYFSVDGEKLKEKNSKWLHDDYVKFIRFAQWKMSTVDQGIVGIITNHRFLSNPTFRGMRQSLMSTFNEIYVFDLHGSNKPKELAPDGGPDENVFDIEQGVAISFFIKKAGLEKKVFHADLFGRREEKYDFCVKNTSQSTNFAEIKPQSPFYLFQPQNDLIKADFEKGYSVLKMFSLGGNGIVSKRDNLSIHKTKESAIQAANDILSLGKDEFYAKYQLPKDVRDWTYEGAKKDIKSCEVNDALIKEILYRPFDTRYIVYTGRSRGFIGWPVVQVMKQMYSFSNIGLLIGRAGQNVDMTDGWNLAFVTNKISDFNIFSRGGGYLCPLYVKLDENPDAKTFDFEEKKIANFRPEFLDFLKITYNEPISAENIFSYLYAILYSPTYRKKYESCLKIDFPRIIFNKDLDIFRQISRVGDELMNAHLLIKIPSIKDFPFGEFKGQGDSLVKHRDFKLKDEKEDVGQLYINSNQFFDNIPVDVWKFNLGGYQTIDKFLKDRIGVKLDLSEIEKVEDLVRVIKFTITKTQEINLLTAKWI